MENTRCLIKCIGYGPTGCDCTHEENLVLTRECTVKEVCEEIINRFKNEHGYIDIKILNRPNHSYRIEYANGLFVDEQRNKIDLNFPTNILNKKPFKISGHGGYTKMDYILYLTGENL